MKTEDSKTFRGNKAMDWSEIWSGELLRYTGAVSSRVQEISAQNEQNRFPLLSLRGRRSY